jgi:hypothetical protein
VVAPRSRGQDRTGRESLGNCLLRIAAIGADETQVAAHRRSPWRNWSEVRKLLIVQSDEVALDRQDAIYPFWRHPIRRNGRQIGFATPVVSKTGQRHCLLDQPIANLGEIASIPFSKRQVAGVFVWLTTAFARRLALLAANSPALLGQAREQLLPIGNLAIRKQLVADKQGMNILADRYA